MEGIKIYVSNDGNDKWSGKIPFPEKNDGPFATIERAKKEIRELKKKGKLKFPVYVYIRGGIYYLEKPLIFTPQDSGTPLNPIIYTSYKNEKVILSGGKIVKKFDEVEINGKKGIRIKIEKNLKFSSIWVNGKRRYRAKFPQKGLIEYKREKFPPFNTQENKAEIEILKNVKKPRRRRNNIFSLLG